MSFSQEPLDSNSDREEEKEEEEDDEKKEQECEKEVENGAKDMEEDTLSHQSPAADEVRTAPRRSSCICNLLYEGC